MKVEYVTHWGDDLTPVNAARVSFDKQSEWEEEEVYGEDEHGPYSEYVKKLSDRDHKLVHYLAKHKHTSCFEHQGATLRLKVPIFIARQIQRHRTFSYNEISRRYVDSEPEFYWPDKWRKRAENVKQGSSSDVFSEEPLVALKEWAGGAAMCSPSELVKYVEVMYIKLIEEGVAPELARMILPQNMYTEFYMTGNLRAWAHFLDLRLDGHAQKEVQDVAKMVQDILMPLWPVSMEALSSY